MELDILAMINGGVRALRPVQSVRQRHLAGCRVYLRPVQWFHPGLRSGLSVQSWRHLSVERPGQGRPHRHDRRLIISRTRTTLLQFFVPAYTVWDLTAEVNFCHGRIGVFAGINNVFDEDFWAEVRDEGILPAYGRNYYGGVSIKF